MHNMIKDIKKHGKAIIVKFNLKSEKEVKRAYIQSSDD